MCLLIAHSVCDWKSHKPSSLYYSQHALRWIRRTVHLGALWQRGHLASPRTGNIFKLPLAKHPLKVLAGPKGRVSHWEPLFSAQTPTGYAPVAARGHFETTMCRHSLIGSTGASAGDVWKRPEDILMSCADPLPGISIIQKDKVSRTWEWKAACFPLPVSIFWQRVQTGEESEGTLPYKVFFHVPKWVLPPPLHPWNAELRARSRCAGTVCMDWLT